MQIYFKELKLSPKLNFLVTSKTIFINSISQKGMDLWMINLKTYFLALLNWKTCKIYTYNINRPIPLESKIIKRINRIYSLYFLMDMMSSKINLASNSQLQLQLTPELMVPTQIRKRTLWILKIFFFLLEVDSDNVCSVEEDAPG